MLHWVIWVDQLPKETISSQCTSGSWNWNSQYFGHLMWRTDSSEKALMLGKIEGRRRRGQQRMRWLVTSPPRWWIWIWVISRSWWWTGKPGMLQSMGSQSQIRLSDWIKLNCTSGWCYMGQLTFCFAKWTNYIAQFLTYDLELVMWKFTHRWKNMTPFSFHAHRIEWVTASYCISRKKFLNTWLQYKIMIKIIFKSLLNSEKAKLC